MWLRRLLSGEIRTTRPPSLFNWGKCTHQVLMPDVVSLLWLAWHGSGLLICQDASLSRTLQAHLDRFPFLPCPCLMIREGGRKNIELNRKSVTVYMNVSDDILHEVWKVSHVDFDHENVLWALLLGLPSPLKDFEPNDTSIKIINGHVLISSPDVWLTSESKSLIFTVEISKYWWCFRGFLWGFCRWLQNQFKAGSKKVLSTTCKFPSCHLPLEPKEIS